MDQIAAIIPPDDDDNRYSSPWIGFNDRGEEGSFVWSDGTDAEFTWWDGAEPNDSGGEDCTQMFGDDGDDNKWNDMPCDRELPYVCEFSAAGRCVFRWPSPLPQRCAPVPIA